MIPASPIRSPRSKSRNRAAPCLLAGLLALLVAPRAGAHGGWEQAIPDEPGLRLGAGVALSWYDADDPLPTALMSGVLLTGEPATDRNGARLEHATLDAGWRFDETLGANVAIGWHEDGHGHFEAAWLNAYRSRDDGEWALGAGRRRVPLGPVLDGGGHFDRFGLMPLAKRAALNDDWIEDGVNLTWRGAGDIPLDVDFGLWSGERFPGSGGSDVFPQLHVGAGIGHVRLDGFIARVSPDGRGAYIQRTQSGHSHGVPGCGQSLLLVVCFEGDVDLVGGSLRWFLHDHAVELSAAGLARRDRGDLYSASGDARYEGRTRAGWLEAIWGFRPDWTLAARLEGAAGRHELAGYGATLVAGEAGLLPDPGATRRATLLLAWSPRADLTLSAELGQERNDLASNDFVGLRLIWRQTLRQAPNARR